MLSDGISLLRGPLAWQRRRATASILRHAPGISKMLRLADCEIRDIVKGPLSRVLRSFSEAMLPFVPREEPLTMRKPQAPAC